MRVACLWIVCLVFIILYGMNLFFQWTQGWIESSWLGWFSTILSAVVLPVSVARVLFSVLGTRAYKQLLQQAKRGPRRNTAPKHRITFIMDILDKIFAYFLFPAEIASTFIYTPGWTNMSYAAFEVTGLVASLLVVYGHELLYKDILQKKIAALRSEIPSEDHDML